MLLSSWKAEYKNQAYQLSKVDADWVMKRIVADQFNAYTTLRTFNNSYVYWLDEHFTRLQQSAELMGKNSLLDGDALRIVLKNIMNACPVFPDYRIRIYFSFDEPYGTVYIQIHDLVLPTTDDYQNGVHCITRTMQRNSPKAKLSQFITKADEVRSTIPEGIHEVIMKNDAGDYLEGISSNFYAILNNTIYTAENDVLGGIVRKMVLGILEKKEIAYTLKSANEKDLSRFEETFITSSGRGVLPVTMIDDQNIGDGKPGKITRLIMEAYAGSVQAQLEPIR